MRNIVLVTSEVIDDANLARLSAVASVCSSRKLDERSLLKILPNVDALVVFFWPGFLTSENLARMKRLRFIQSVLVGVNHFPYHDLRAGIVIASNAGAYSLEVGEHAWALLLAAAKKVVADSKRLADGAISFAEFSGEARDIVVLKGKTLGIIGYGGIGATVAGYARAFGMNVLAYGRNKRRIRGVEYLRGSKGLASLLKQSDAILLSVPLNRSTQHLIGKRQLAIMKKHTILVNVARGDLVDQEALYGHLTANPRFTYATDVFWAKSGRESLETDYKFQALPNFIGTPHMSGPTGIVSGTPATSAVDNVLRFFTGKRPKNLVDRSDYLEAV
ncbi:MAG: hypothetical protein OK422_04625 [Thaumarchaeota archaeon]|nr:hypothetical protein [Nitrososphaerota archaeon]